MRESVVESVSLICIGGPRDGQRAVSTVDVLEISFPVGMTQPLGGASYGVPQVKVSTSIAVYRRQTISGEAKAFHFWLWQHTTVDEALFYLLKRYAGEHLTYDSDGKPHSTMHTRTHDD